MSTKTNTNTKTKKSAITNENEIDSTQEYGYSATFAYTSDKTILASGKEDQGAAVEMLSRIQDTKQSDVESMYFLYILTLSILAQTKQTKHKK